jgi:membrane protease YdiL (CAAX protease family)
MSRAVDTGSVAVREGGGFLGAYFQDSELPLTSLIFLLPLIVIYEVGTQYFTTAAQHGQDQQIIAFMMMQRFFRLFGVHGQHLPAVAVVTILLCEHALRNKRWQLNLGTLAGMAIESALLALPLIAIARELSRYFPLSASGGTRQDIVIMSLGAGVYEELVFRLILFSFLSLALKDAMRLNSFWVHLGVVSISAFAFSGYHYLSPLEHFQWRSFIFRTVAGAYFGVLFLLRGFGITCGCHAAYDVLILFL